MIITFGDVEITKYLRPTRGLDRKILPDTDHRLEKIGRSDGFKHLGTSYGMRTISMPFRITNDLIKNRRDLARVLSTREPLPLVFDDEPDKCWFALPSGDISVDELVILGHGVIDWIVPDGMAHSLAPRVFTNVTLPVTAQNQVLDPEYKNKAKYYKQWTSLLHDVYNGSNVLQADFTNVWTVAGDGEYKYMPDSFNKFFIVQNDVIASRSFPDVKVNDPFSAAVELRFHKTATSDPRAERSAVLIVQELMYSGGGILKSHTVYPKEAKLGEFQKLTLSGKITHPSTKYLRLLVGVNSYVKVDIAKSQYNLGATLAPYTETKTTLTDYIAVTNPGSYKAWPIIRATMNGENGLVGLLNLNEGVLQFGSAEETDIAVGKRTDKVVSIAMRNDGDKFEVNSPKAKPAYPNFLGNAATPNKVAGSWNWTANPEAATPVFAANNDKVWSGPTLYKEFASNRENSYKGDFIWKNRLDFASDVRQEGRSTFTLQNSSGPILSAVVRDSTGSKSELIVEFRYKLNVIHTVTLDKKEWTGKFWEVSISKTNGVNVEFKFSKWQSFSGEGIIASKTYIFNVTYPELADTEIKALCHWATKWHTAPAAYMDWTDTKFYWNNETEVTNIPNTFDDGDILEIDVANRRVSLNGIENNYLHALGNRWERFAVEPGTTTFLPVSSSWANMFAMEVELRGAYI